MIAITPQQRDLLAICALRAGSTSVDWNLIARTCQSPEALHVVLGGDLPEDSAVARKNLPVLRDALPYLDEARARVASELEAAKATGARLVTVLDPAYPANLRLVPNLPPFLFHLGDLEERDARSAAVVGTRNASDDGMRRAGRMARGLVDNDVVVFSGLAKGIDTAAHTAALEAGGRTVAVMGTGIAAKIYPAENKPLAARIVDNGGALLSQFWPTSGPATWTFPRRNVVTSGSTMGSIVIEASSTSGAKMQARIAHEHGKHVFLIRSLATKEPWAAKMVAERKAVEVAELDDVLSLLGSAKRVQQAAQQRLQLALAGL
ncbi:DNA-protecting protein DprA [Streptomyces sp. HNM0663]|uniref:DNA-protecting protein DprA n=1 Tax=Streptomyces chengmaiensis TaxID=3040919 RepID=A0ABT6HYF1_9ACTN|nr:DNA-protecting protein DprA [Streptomyces chengmaiensis]MDH2393741.1 DNA-protecting protein DprA [Streptomyces chengmaiensis]